MFIFIKINKTNQTLTYILTCIFKLVPIEQVTK